MDFETFIAQLRELPRKVKTLTEIENQQIALISQLEADLTVENVLEAMGYLIPSVRGNIDTLNLLTAKVSSLLDPESLKEQTPQNINRILLLFPPEHPWCQVLATQENQSIENRLFELRTQELLYIRSIDYADRSKYSPADVELDLLISTANPDRSASFLTPFHEVLPFCHSGILFEGLDSQIKQFHVDGKITGTGNYRQGEEWMPTEEIETAKETAHNLDFNEVIFDYLHIDQIRAIYYCDFAEDTVMRRRGVKQSLDDGSTSILHAFYMQQFIKQKTGQELPMVHFRPSHYQSKELQFEKTMVTKEMFLAAFKVAFCRCYSHLALTEIHFGGSRSPAQRVREKVLMNLSFLDKIMTVLPPGWVDLKIEVLETASTDLEIIREKAKDELKNHIEELASILIDIKHPKFDAKLFNKRYALFQPEEESRKGKAAPSSSSSK